MAAPGRTRSASISPEVFDFVDARKAPGETWTRTLDRLLLGETPPDDGRVELVFRREC